MHNIYYIKPGYIQEISNICMKNEKFNIIN
jgi:hypothetical protein